MSLNIVTKFSTLPSGIQLYTERVTASDAPADGSPATITLIHGLTSSVNSWYPIYGSLLYALPSATLVAYDWSGCGLSPVHPSRADKLTFAHLVEDLDTLRTQEAMTSR